MIAKEWVPRKNEIPKTAETKQGIMYRNIHSRTRQHKRATRAAVEPILPIMGACRVEVSSSRVIKEVVRE